MILRAALLAVAAMVSLGVAPLYPDQGPPLTVHVDRGTGAPLISVGEVLRDPSLEEAVRSGLPLRLRFHVELWRDEWFDDLVVQRTWSAVLAYEPLEDRFMAGDADNGEETLARFADYDAARTTLERTWVPPMRPVREGSYYYIVNLEIETLSLSDLDELERWLRGELQPAVRGAGSVTGAVGTGVKRLLIRVLDLPARRYTSRSPRFTVP